MGYNFPYKVYASEVLRELRKSKDPRIVDKFIDELIKQDNFRKNGYHMRYIGEYISHNGVNRVVGFLGNGV